jgi:hypothetical protein
VTDERHIPFSRLSPRPPPRGRPLRPVPSHRSRPIASFARARSLATTHVTTERRPPCARIVGRALAIAPPRAIPASLLANRTTSLVPRVPTRARAALVALFLDAFAVTGRAVVVVLVVVAIIPIESIEEVTTTMTTTTTRGGATRARDRACMRHARVGLEDVCVWTRGS